MSDLKEMLATIEEHEVDDHIGRHGWGVVAKKLLKWLYYFMACSRVWKRKATIYRSEYIQEKKSRDHFVDWWHKAEDTATRRLELLKEIIEMLGYCPFCWANAKQYHADDCKLAKELADEDSEGGISHAVGSKD